ncbi:MAG: GHKL domain-containing protein [Desulfobacterales bacterium]|nr:GHKL domain-containing protein [Desulfobacterales bacterium]
MSIPTKFLPAERNTNSEIQLQSNYFAEIPFLKQIIDSIPDIVMILNRQRQIVFANQALLEHPDLNTGTIFGLRPGETLGCIHADKTEGGCGTTEFCKTCGATKSVLSSQKGKSDIQECRITRKENLGSLDLRVKASPLTVHNENFTVFVITNISHEKRRRALERIFFHDILNIAGVVKGFSDLMTAGFAENRDEYAKMINRSIDMLIGEINAQRDLAAAENNELLIHPGQINSAELLQEVAGFYEHHKSAHRRHIKLDDNMQEIVFTNDKTLLSRVLGNMLKNALEASNPGGTVTLGCEKHDEKIRFWIHNPGIMANEVQLQVFQRSFSTKSQDRGLGTYGMKLLTERYLKGSVSFFSSEKKGTVFNACYPLEFET